MLQNVASEQYTIIINQVNVNLSSFLTNLVTYVWFHRNSFNTLLVLHAIHSFATVNNWLLCCLACIRSWSSIAKKIWQYYWNTSLQKSIVLSIAIMQMQYFLAKRDYVMFGYMLWQIRLSVVCDLHAPYSGGLTLQGYFLHHIVAWQSGKSPTKNHKDRPRASPPVEALNALG